MLEEERALLQLVHDEPVQLPAGAWERVQARLHEPVRTRERLTLWVWWNRRWIAQTRWAAAAAVVILAIGAWLPTHLQTPSQEAEILSGYAQAVSYAQSSVVDDPLNENTQIILGGWSE